MREKFAVALKEATRSQDKRRISTLRLINAAIKDRDIAARGSGKERIDDDEILQVLAKMIKQREESAKIYEEAGRLELAEQERAETVIIRDFLPKQLSEQEVHAAAKAIVAELGATGLRDMGPCMAALKERYAGQMDFGKAGAVIKSLLK